MAKKGQKALKAIQESDRSEKNIIFFYMSFAL